MARSRGLVKKTTSLVLKAAVSITSFAVLMWVIPFRDQCVDPMDRATCKPGLITTVSNARAGVIALLALLPFLSAVVWAARWRILLGIGGRPPPLAEVWRITVESQAGGVLLPGGIGGDALRIAWAAEAGVPLGVAVGSVGLDRAVGLTMLALTAAALGFGLGGLSAGPLAFALAAIPLAFLAGMSIVRSRYLDPRAPLVAKVLDGRLGAPLRPLFEYARAPAAPRAIVQALAVGALLSVYQLGLIRGLVYALRATPSHELQVYVGTAMAFIVFALPALPGAWGTGDAAFVFFLAPAGLDAGVALCTSMLYRLFWYSQGLFGAAVALAGTARASRERR